MTERNNHSIETGTYITAKSIRLPSPSLLSLGSIYEENKRAENEISILWKRVGKIADYTLNNKQISSLPKEFNCKNFCLKSVDLSSNCFRKIPSELFILNHLQILKMDFNMINAIPPDIENLKELEVLSIAHNSIYYINPSIEKLKLLTVLILNNNFLEEWPVTNLPNLRILHLHNNPNIADIPLRFTKLLHLKELKYDWFEYLPNGWNKEAHKDHLLIEIKKLCAILALKQTNSICSFTTFIEYLVTSKHEWQKQVNPLHIAAKKSHNEVMLKQLIRICDLNLKDKHEKTPLVIAVEEGNKEGTKLLLQNPHINVNCFVPYQGSIFNVALKHNWNDIALIILSHPSFAANYKDCLGNIPLHGLFDSCLSMPEDSIELFRKLMSFGNFSLNIRNNKDLTPLHLAVMKNRLLFVQLALKHNKTQDVRKFDFNAIECHKGFSVFHIAAAYASIEVVNELVLNGVQLFTKNKYGKIPREMAKNSAIRKLLLKCEMKKLHDKDELIITEHSSSRDTVTMQNPPRILISESNLVSSRVMIQDHTKKNYKNKQVISDSRKTKIKYNIVYDSLNEEEEDAGNKEDQYLATAYEDVINKINITKEQFILIKNKYSDLYEVLTNKRCKRIYKYKALYYLFKQSNKDAMDIVELVANKLPPNDDISYLLELQKLLLQT